MGPDEENDYSSAMLMHFNPDTGKWEEVAKLEDVKEIIETPDVDGMYFDAATQLYMVYELKLVRDANTNTMVYDISKEYPSGIGSFLCRKDAIDCITSTYGSAMSLCEGGLYSKLRKRFRGIMANRSGNVIMLIGKLRDSNTKNGCHYIPKIVDAFEILDGQFNKVVILIRVR